MLTHPKSIRILTNSLRRMHSDQSKNRGSSCGEWQLSKGLGKTTGSGLLKRQKSEVWQRASGKLTWECGAGFLLSYSPGVNMLKSIHLALEKLHTSFTNATGKACSC